jgi:hypothetical protein
LEASHRVSRHVGEWQSDRVIQSQREKAKDSEA